MNKDQELKNLKSSIEQKLVKYKETPIEISVDRRNGWIPRHTLFQDWTKKKCYLNRPITVNEIESVVKKKKKCHKVQDFTGEFYKTFYEELQFSFSNYSKNLKRKKHF